MACFNAYVFLSVCAVMAALVGGTDGEEPDCKIVQGGFGCPARKDCRAYFLYQIKDSQQQSNIAEVGILFGVTQLSDIADASHVNVSQPLVSNQFLIVPLNCSCIGELYQANVSYTVQDGDNFYALAHGTFQNLTTCNSIAHANPSADPFNLKPKSNLLIPLHCSCPTFNQLDGGVRHILTYPVQKDSHLKAVSDFLNVSVEELKAANGLDGEDPAVKSGEELLVPIRNEIDLPIPAISSPPLPMSKQRILSRNVFFILGAFMIGSVFIVGFLYAYHRTRRLRFRLEVPSKNTAQIRARAKAKAKADLSVAQDLKTMGKLMNISFEEIKEATHDFSPECNIQGSVFFCKLRGERIAFKRTEGDVSPEISILASVHHRNLVKPLGLCKTSEFSYVAYEYVEKGTLAYWLQTGNLSWTDRLRIAHDVATGLEYLHHHTRLKLVHAQINSGNILLDMNLDAKIAKVGKAKLMPPDSNGSFREKLESNNYGYEAPEYISGLIVSQELDVFAFGVLLLELLSGRQVVMSRDDEDDGDGGGGDTFLWSTIGPILDAEYPKERLAEWMDPALEKVFPLDCALGLAFIAKTCVEATAKLRPNMNDINYNISKLLGRSLWWQTSIGREIKLALPEDEDDSEHRHEFERDSTVTVR